MIYLHETFEFNADLAEDYLTHVVTEMKEIVVAGGRRPIGLFRTALRNIEGVFLWEGDDWPQIPTWSSSTRRPELASYLAQRLPYRKDWTDRLLVPAEFSPTAAEVLSRGYKDKMYLQVTAEVLPGKLVELVALIGDQGIALSRNRGMDLVGCYETAAGNGVGNEVIVVWAIDDWAHWGAVRDARNEDMGVRSYVSKAQAMLRHWSFKFLLPVPASPLQ